MSSPGRRRDDQADPLLVRIDEAARLLGISRSHVWELVLRGELSVVRLGRRTLISRALLDEIAAGHKGGWPA